MTDLDMIDESIDEFLYSSDRNLLLKECNTYFVQEFATRKTIVSFPESEEDQTEEEVDYLTWRRIQMERLRSQRKVS